MKKEFESFSGGNGGSVGRRLISGHELWSWLWILTVRFVLNEFVVNLTFRVALTMGDREQLTGGILLEQGILEPL